MSGSPVQPCRSQLGLSQPWDSGCLLPAPSCPRLLRHDREGASCAPWGSLLPDSPLLGTLSPHSSGGAEGTEAHQGTQDPMRWKLVLGDLQMMWPYRGPQKNQPLPVPSGQSPRLEAGPGCSLESHPALPKPLFRMLCAAQRSSCCPGNTPPQSCSAGLFL